MSFVIESFSRELNRATFDCGEESLNYWLHAQSGQQEKRGNTRTFLAREENVNHVVGYYSSVIAQIEASQSAQVIGVGTGRYPISAVLIARLAVDLNHQGSGLGSLLLVHALRGALSISEHAGLEVVVVDALNVEAMAFYRRHGFASFEDNPLRLFVTLKQIAVSLRDL